MTSYWLLCCFIALVFIGVQVANVALALRDIAKKIEGK